MYADDGTLFVENLTQLPGIIRHIQMVRKYTGLNFNLDKTVAFSHHQKIPISITGVLAHSAPVKYLGVIVGAGDLTMQNFTHVLEKACLVTK